MRSTFRTLQAALLASGLSLGLSGVASAEDKAGSWTDNLTVGAFVDSYVALRSDNNAARAGNGNPLINDYYHQGYVNQSGFGLAFAGMDVSYSGEKFGATVSLRYGPGVNRFYLGNTSDFGINNITQAYATWKPFDKLTLDLGQFGTLFGAEVAESWRNMNYSRGGLYYLMQPFWHTGLRANFAINDMLAVNAMVVNGVNTLFENNKSPTLGLQFVVTPIESLFLAVGYMGTLNPYNERSAANALAGGQNVVAFQNFIDVVATLSLGDFKLVGNFDINLYKDDPDADQENWWGISLAPGYSFTNWLGAAVRVEYLSDSANYAFGMTDKMGVGVDKASMTTLTGTLDLKPVPNSGALVLRPEFRMDLASDQYFLNRDNETDTKFWTLMLGAVVTSM